MTNDEPQTKKACRAKHKIIGAVGSLVALCAAVAFVLPLWSFAASRRAEEKATVVDKAFGEHEAAQKVHEQHLHETLGRIEKTQGEILQAIVRGK